ncbi:MAG TPA: hypothetical protein PLC42_02610 [Parachlamydiaceae bacterium]|nr:hypothetical protein [Parachlamydiaceae bacterium]
MLKKYFFALFLLSSQTSCYRMPTDHDYCLVPNLNNPDITRDKGTNKLAPGLGF